MFCVEAKVEALISPLVEVTPDSSDLVEAVGHLKNILGDVVSHIIKALYFVILKVSPRYKCSLCVCVCLCLFVCVFVSIYILECCAVYTNTGVSVLLHYSLQICTCTA